jgi:cytochrome c-type biogenesis protein CcmH
MTPRRAVLAAFALGVVAGAACRETAGPPPPSPSPAAREGGLRPLTSRDGPAASAGEAPALPPGHPPFGQPAPGAPALAAPGASVSGSVVVAPGLAARVRPGDVLYLIARSAKTNGVVAVRREDELRFPFAFSISGADVMMEGTPFAGPFDLTARLSKTGDAIAGPGDVEGTTRGVALGATGVTITLDTLRQ